MSNKQSYVWYANYGSNLDRKRFLCYVDGTQPVGAKKCESGCHDKAPPKDDKPIDIPFPLYFAEQSPRWNNCGVAFIGLTKDHFNNTLGRMYLITKEQFEDVFSQENNCSSISIDLDDVRKNGSKAINTNWYGNIIYLGDDNHYSIFTFTSCSDIGQKTFRAPSPDYLKHMVHGLRESRKLTIERIVEYLICKPDIKGHHSIIELMKLVSDFI